MHRVCAVRVSASTRVCDNTHLALLHPSNRRPRTNSPCTDYLNKKYPEPPLEPADAAAAAKARLFIELFNTHFTGNMFGEGLFALSRAAWLAAQLSCG